MDIKNVRRARRKAMKENKIETPKGKVHRDKTKYSRKKKHKDDGM
jgi:hypothetical protein